MPRTQRSRHLGPRHAPLRRLFRRLEAAAEAWSGERREHDEPDHDERDERERGLRSPHPTGLTRRQFLRGAGALTAAAAAAPLAQPLAALAATDARVVVIGAGAAGVRTAHRLHQLGIPSTVYEASSRIGGRTFSVIDFFADGQVAEHGGEFISTEHTATRRLARNLGLQLEVINGGALPDGQEIYHIDGAFYTYAEALADWRVAWMAFKEELRAAPWPQTFDAHTERGRQLDSISVPEWFDPGNPHSNPVLAGFGPSSRFARLLQASALAEYGGDAGDQPALNLLYLLAWNPRNSLSPLAGTDELYRIRGGKRSAGAADGGRHAGRPHRHRACAVRDSWPAARSVHLPLRRRLERRGRSPGARPSVPAAARGRHRPPHLGGSHPAEARRHLDAADGTSAKLHLQVDERTWTRPITVDGQQIRPNGVSYSDPDGFGVVWDGSVPSASARGILVDFLGGTAGTRLKGPGAFGPASNGDVVQFLSAIEPVFSGTTAAYSGRALKSSWVDSPWHRGAYSFWGIGQYSSFAGVEGRQEGRIHFCGEHTSIDHQGFIEGAVRSGERAAKAIHQQV